jgi:hypothetical protein
VSAVDEAVYGHIHTLSPDELSTVNPRLVAVRIGATISDVVAALERAVERGDLRHRFRVLCPVTDGGVRWAESTEELAGTYACDLCDLGQHAFDPEFIEIRYAPSD